MGVVLTRQLLDLGQEKKTNLYYLANAFFFSFEIITQFSQIEKKKKFCFYVKYHSQHVCC